MDIQQSTPKPDEIQASTLNDALNLHWKYFKSRSGDILAKTYASDALTHLSGFIEISAAEYARLESEQRRV